MTKGSLGKGHNGLLQNHKCTKYDIVEPRKKNNILTKKSPCKGSERLLQKSEMENVKFIFDGFNTYCEYLNFCRTT